MNDILDRESDEKASLQSVIRLTTLIYILQAISIFLAGIPALVAVIINYVKREDVQGTLGASHFKWQIRTFWFGLLWLSVDVFLLIVGLGMPMIARINGFYPWEDMSFSLGLMTIGISVWLALLGASIWLLYRIIKGWMRLNDRKEMYV